MNVVYLRMYLPHLKIPSHETLCTLLGNVVRDFVQPGEPIKLDQVCQLTGPSRCRSGRAWRVCSCVESVKTNLPHKR